MNKDLIIEAIDTILDKGVLDLSDLANYLVLNSAGGIIDHQSRECFAPFSNGGDDTFYEAGEDGVLVVIESTEFDEEGEYSSDILHRYTKYLLEDSPYKDIFIDLGSYNGKAIAIKLSAPANALGHAITSYRTFMQYPEYAARWMGWVEAGLEPRVATYLALMYEAEGDVAKETRDIPGHSVFGYEDTKEVMYNYIAGNMNPYDSAANVGGYKNCGQTFLVPSRNHIKATDLFKDMSSEKREVGRNPFSGKPVLQATFTVEDMVSHFNELYKEVACKSILSAA